MQFQNQQVRLLLLSLDAWLILFKMKKGATLGIDVLDERRNRAKSFEVCNSLWWPLCISNIDMLSSFSQWLRYLLFWKHWKPSKLLKYTNEFWVWGFWPTCGRWRSSVAERTLRKLIRLQVLISVYTSTPLFPASLPTQIYLLYSEGGKKRKIEGYNWSRYEISEC